MRVCPVCSAEYGEDAAFCAQDRTPLRPVGSDPDELLGRVVAERYAIERRLGGGGMGEVYLTRHVLMGRLSALKILSRDLTQDPEAIKRFNREATNASRISHPNVCAVYDFGLTADGLVFLAMEYVEGQPLRALLTEFGRLPVPRAAALLSQCAAGLQAAHDLGIVHRDLKPDNIMVVSAGGESAERVKLVDFGIAKAIAGEGESGVTRTGFIVGTPEYMSPEQLSGARVDARSDQYSLALVFYEAITGLLPFEGGSLRGALSKRLTEPPRPLHQARPDGGFPASLQAVMSRALAREPGERFASVREFAFAVVRVMDGGSALGARRSAGRWLGGLWERLSGSSSRRLAGPDTR
ncbi:MAG: serine/threonine-protein kinase [Gemmatimonadales bacterium]